jgi:hypothetical protein
VIHLSTENGELFEHAFQHAQKQVRKLIEKHPLFYPLYTQNGKWKHEGPAWTHWCDGFLPGMMWIFHKRTPPDSADSKYWLEQAIRYTKPLEPRKDDRDVHDLGFLFLSTYYRWYRLTRDPVLRDVLIEAGRTLALRFKEKGQYLRSFVADNSLFIDIMMNVGIIFYAARETGDRRLRDVAMRHSLHHAPRAGARRRIHRTRRNLRHLDRRISAADHAPGVSRRFVLVARAGLVAVRIHHLLRVQPRSAFSRDRANLRRLLHHALACGRRAAVGLQCAAGKSHAVGYFGGSDRGRGSVPLVPTGAGRVEGTFVLGHSGADHALAMRETSFQIRSEVGRDSQGRRVSRSQRPGRR